MFTRVISAFVCLLILFSASATHAAIVGIDFGPSGQTTPTNWTSLTAEGTYNALIDETGAATGISLTVSDTGGTMMDWAANLKTSTVPSHTPSLVDLSGNIFRFTTDTLSLAFTGLTPGHNYHLWLLGLRDGGTLDQAITITGGGAPINFNQNGSTRDLVVNSTVGDSAVDLEDYAVTATADSGGSISISVDGSSVGMYCLAGIAIEPVYTVTYDANGATGGSVPTDANLYSSGTSHTVSGNTGSLMRDGFQFVSWNTTADGSGTTYAPGASLTIPSADVTLYAQWKSGGGDTPSVADANTFWFAFLITMLFLGGMSGVARRRRR